MIDARLIHPQSRFMQGIFKIRKTELRHRLLRLRTWFAVHAVMLFLSGSLLFYTAIIVPVQICLWSYDDPCKAFTTLFFDVVVDTFFLVSATADAHASAVIFDFFESLLTSSACSFRSKRSPSSSSAITRRT